MDKLDEQLRSALRRVDAPTGFAERVVARAACEEGHAGRPRWWAAPLLRWGVTAVALIAIVLGGLEYRREQRQRAEGEAARQQAVLALRIAGAKLKLARGKVQQLSAQPAQARSE